MIHWATAAAHDSLSESIAVTNLLQLLSNLQYRHGELDDYLQTTADSLAAVLQIAAVALTLQQSAGEALLAGSTAELWGAGGEAGPRAPSLSWDGFQARYDACLRVALPSAQGQVIGYLYCGDRGDRQFLEMEVCIAKIFAERAASAVERYLLLRRQQIAQAVPLRSRRPLALVVPPPLSVCSVGG